MRQILKEEAEIGDTAYLWSKRKHVQIKDKKTKLEVKTNDKYSRLVWRKTKMEKLDEA